MQLHPGYLVLESSLDPIPNLQNFLNLNHVLNTLILPKLLQKIVLMSQEVLYEIFVDIQKAYDALDQGCALSILEGYRLGTQVCQLLTQYWDRANMVVRASR